MKHNSVRNQEIKGKLVDREVIRNASILVYELSQKAEHFPDYEDDIYSAFTGHPDYEECAIQNGWRIKVNKNIWPEWVTDNYNESEVEEANFVNDSSEEISSAENWEELCNEQNLDVYDYAPEIFEHWIVTDWFGRELEDYGHKVLRDFFGFTIWCRPTTGQAILLDGVISKIAEEMEILEGQKHEWK